MSSRLEAFRELFFTVRDSPVEAADLVSSESVGEDDFGSHRLRVLDVTDGLGSGVSNSGSVRVAGGSGVVHSVDVAFSGASLEEASSGGISGLDSGVVLFSGRAVVHDVLSVLRESEKQVAGVSEASPLFERRRVDAVGESAEEVGVLHDSDYFEKGVDRVDEFVISDSELTIRVDKRRSSSRVRFDNFTPDQIEGR